MSPSLSARDLSLAYGRKTVLNRLSIEFPAGQITALCGPNGCGKSSLLRALAGLIPAQGEIQIQGRPLAGYSRTELARCLTMLAQFNQIPAGLSVGEMVSYGRFPHQPASGQLSAADRAAIDTALQATGLEALADQEVAALSGGERQRAWIAMALAQQCQILLLDEPTTYLDVHHQADILRALRQLNRTRQISILWVLHDLNQAAEFSDRMVFMQAGQIRHQGSPEQLMTPAILEQIFGLPMLSIRHPQSGKALCLPCYDQP